MVFVALAFALALLFVRLGFWQLDRLAERRKANVSVAQRMTLPPALLTHIDPSSIEDRPAFVVGVPDTANEFVLMGRSRNGSPGVHILTPVRLTTGEVALVNRGWVYSPDAATVDVAPWREARDSFAGYGAILRDAPTPATALKGRGVRVLTRESVKRLLPYPVDNRYLIVTDSPGRNAPARLTTPNVSDGPHLNYAIQWFAFAAIAVVGASIVIARRKQHVGIGSTGA